MQRKVKWGGCRKQLWRTGLEVRLRGLRRLRECCRSMLRARITQFRFMLVILSFRLQLLLLQPAFKKPREVSSSDILLVAIYVLLSVVPPASLQIWLDPGKGCSVDGVLLEEVLLATLLQNPTTTAVVVTATEGKGPLLSR